MKFHERYRVWMLVVSVLCFIGALVLSCTPMPDVRVTSVLLVVCFVMLIGAVRR